MSIFPMISPPDDQGGSSKELPLYREVAWDFTRDVPVFRGGAPVVVTEKEALKVWIWRALRNPRYKYETYTWAYGSEFESLLGQSYSDSVKTAEAPRYLRECLLVNPYITAVKNINVTFEEARLTVRGTAVTVYGEERFYPGGRAVQCKGDKQRRRRRAGVGGLHDGGPQRRQPHFHQRERRQGICL